MHTRYSPVRRSPPGGRSRPPVLPLDLHVLSLSLAFILSQDQTLRCEVCLNVRRMPPRGPRPENKRARDPRGVAAGRRRPTRRRARDPGPLSAERSAAPPEGGRRGLNGYLVPGEGPRDACTCLSCLQRVCKKNKERESKKTPREKPRKRGGPESGCKDRDLFLITKIFDNFFQENLYYFCLRLDSQYFHLILTPLSHCRYNDRHFLGERVTKIYLFLDYNKIFRLLFWLKNKTP